MLIKKFFREKFKQLQVIMFILKEQISKFYFDVVKKIKLFLFSYRYNYVIAA